MMNEEVIIRWTEKEIRAIRDSIAANKRELEWLTGRLTAHEERLRTMKGRKE